MLNFIKNLFADKSNELKTALNNGAIILDVRTTAEYKQGHIEGSKNIPLNQIKLKVDLIRRWNKPVITVYRSGGRSSAAKNILLANGVQVINGGAWTSLEKKLTN